MAILINGNLNDPVYASQDSDLLAAIVGNTTCITQVGYQFAHELEDANTVMVKDGVIITKEGRRIQLDAGDVDEFLIPTGTQGVTAYYICGYHLYTDGESAELCETFVTLMGSSSETIPENTFRAGATEVYVSLLRVTQSGVNISAVTNLLPSSNTIKQIMTSISNINTSLTALSNNKVNLSGDTMTGNLNFGDGTGGSSTTIPVIKFQNQARNIHMQLQGDGTFRFYDNTNKYAPFNVASNQDITIGNSSKNSHIQIGGKEVMRTLSYANSATPTWSTLQWHAGATITVPAGDYLIIVRAVGVSGYTNVINLVGIGSSSIEDYSEGSIYVTYKHHTSQATIAPYIYASGRIYYEIRAISIF